MSLKLTAILLAVALATTACAVEEVKPAAAATPDTVVAAAKPDGGKLICERRKVTGSRFPETVCRTQEQIDRMKEGGEELARRILDAPMAQKSN